MAQNDNFKVIGNSRTDAVIDGIRRLLSEGELIPGSKLPNEKSLCELLDVSRGSLREGVRALAALGVLETRQGDGTYVRELDSETILSPLELLGELYGSTHSTEFLHVRRVLEVESARLATQNLNEAELEHLEKILDSVEYLPVAPTEADIEKFIEADTKFHVAIARASMNEPLAALIQTFVGRTFQTRIRRAITNHDSITETQCEHRAILNAFKERDSEKAQLRMAIHLLGVEEYSSEVTSITSA